MVKFEDMREESQAWANEYCKALNNSSDYEDAAKDWGVEFEGAMLMVFQPSGEVEENVTSFVDLKGGKCIGITLLTPDEDPPREPGFVLSAPMLIWKKLSFLELDPVQALMTQKLKLEGDLNIIMKFQKAAVLLATTTEKTDRSLFEKYDLGE